MADVLADETGDEVVAVIKAGVHAQGQRVAGGITGRTQHVRAQLRGKKFIGRTLINQQW